MFEYDVSLSETVLRAAESAGIPKGLCPLTPRGCYTLVLPVGVLYPHTPLRGYYTHALPCYLFIAHSNARFVKEPRRKFSRAGVLYPHTPKLLRDVINMLLYVT